MVKQFTSMVNKFPSMVNKFPSMVKQLTSMVNKFTSMVQRLHFAFQKVVIMKDLSNFRNIFYQRQQSQASVKGSSGNLHLT